MDDSPALPRALEGLRGDSWMSAAEVDRIVQLLPDRGWLLEVGSGSGSTAAFIADQRPKARIVSIDPFTEFPDRYADWLPNKQPNQTLWLGAFAEFAILCHAKFDVIVIDGDHAFQSVYDDLMHAAFLLRSGGAILCHDYGDPTHYQVKDAVDRFCEGRGEVVGTCGSLAEVRLR